MRLDKYLKITRIIKRRTVSNDVCDAHRVSVNGRIAKAGCSIKPNDIIEIAFGGKIARFRVLFIDEREAREAQKPMFEAIE